jgi:hypothetical protein
MQGGRPGGRLRCFAPDDEQERRLAVLVLDESEVEVGADGVPDDARLSFLAGARRRGFETLA